MLRPFIWLKSRSSQMSKAPYQISRTVVRLPTLNGMADFYQYTLSHTPSGKVVRTLLDTNWIAPAHLRRQQATLNSASVLNDLGI